MNVYLDGGLIRNGPNLYAKQAVIGWGIVIQTNTCEEQIELSGSFLVEKTTTLNHEMVAFMEAVTYLIDNGHEPEDVNFITDDQLVVYGSQLGPWNGIGYSGYHNALCEAFEVLEQYYSIDLILEAMNFVRYSRFHKVKGHSRCALNNRCDYLAKVQMRRIAAGSRSMLDFEKWAKNGLTMWNKALASNEQVYLPFCATLKEAA